MMVNEKSNIILIGMPGCGKTTIGKLLAEKLHKPFIDIDTYIEEVQSRTISEIFTEGESYFRDIESKAVKNISKGEGLIISTGGGVIKRKENIESLKKNGIILFIDRPIENIASDVDTDNRPLLKDKKDALHALYTERYELYKEYCDFHIENVEEIDTLIEKIIEIITLL
jgi:shikimate kinase